MGRAQQFMIPGKGVAGYNPGAFGDLALALDFLDITTAVVPGIENQPDLQNGSTGGSDSNDIVQGSGYGDFGGTSDARYCIKTGDTWNSFTDGSGSTIIGAFYFTGSTSGSLIGTKHGFNNIEGFYLFVSGGGTVTLRRADGTQQRTTSVASTKSAWHWFVAYEDPIAEEIGLAIDDFSFTTGSVSGYALVDGTEDLTIGTASDLSGNNWSGRMCHMLGYEGKLSSGDIETVTGQMIDYAAANNGITLPALP